MNINDLREAKQKLEQAISYAPPEGATIRVFEIAELAGMTAQHRYDDLAPVFALMDAIDDLARRVDDLWDAIEAQATEDGLSSQPS